MHTGAMKISLLLLLLPVSLLADDAEKAKGAPPAKEGAAEQAPGRVRLKFVPAKKGQGRGASGTTLSRKSFEPTALTAMIHIGLEESFPVVDEKGKTHFTITMTEGDDEHFVFEISSAEGVQKVGVVRNDPSEVKMGGRKYEIVCPVTEVAAGSKATSDQVMVFVKLPQ